MSMPMDVLPALTVRPRGACIQVARITLADLMTRDARASVGDLVALLLRATGLIDGGAAAFAYHLEPFTERSRVSGPWCCAGSLCPWPPLGCCCGSRVACCMGHTLIPSLPVHCCLCRTCAAGWSSSTGLTCTC